VGFVVPVGDRVGVGASVGLWVGRVGRSVGLGDPEQTVLATFWTRSQSDCEAPLPSKADPALVSLHDLEFLATMVGPLPFPKVDVP